MTSFSSINYLIALPDETPQEESVLQGISHGFVSMDWALRTIIELPCDAFDFALSQHARLCRRMTGSSWRWMALTANFLPDLPIETENPFWVVFSHSESVFNSVESWARNQILPILHVTSIEKSNSVYFMTVDWRTIRDHLHVVGKKVAELRADFSVESFQETLDNWKDIEQFDVALIARPHNCTNANLLTLLNFGARFAGEKKLMPVPGDESSYVTAIRESAEEVETLRSIECSDRIVSSRPYQIDRIVFAPAMYADLRRRRFRNKPTDEPEGLRDAFRLLQRQEGYYFTTSGAKAAASFSGFGHLIIKERAEELSFQTSAIALLAASNVSPVIRVPNGVNRLSDISNFADHIRSGRSRSAPTKSSRVFSAAQTMLARYVPAELRQFLGRSKVGVKIVADAPLEWLPLEDLPLMLAVNTSRIPATPGNLMVQELRNNERIFVAPEAFKDILVVSTFQKTDKLRDRLVNAMQYMSENSDGNLSFIHKRVSNIEEFVAVVNSCASVMMILDGHGVHDRDSVGMIEVGTEATNVWDLRGRLKPPPVVVLSACDTYAPDRTHATVGAGFLNCGARAVLGTLMPVNADAAAIFASRVALRASWYGRAVTHDFGRAITWSELVWGSLRLDFIFNLLIRLEKEKLLKSEEVLKLSEILNMRIHVGDPEWWFSAKRDLLEIKHMTPHRLSGFIKSVLAEEHTVRYTHFGNPETIIITTEEIHGRPAVAPTAR